MNSYIMRAILAFISSEPTSVQHSIDSLQSHLPVTWGKKNFREAHAAYGGSSGNLSAKEESEP